MWEYEAQLRQEKLRAEGEVWKEQQQIMKQKREKLRWKEWQGKLQ